MKIVKKHPFNSQITALEMGYGIIGRPLMNVYCYLIGDTLIDCGQAKMAGEMKSFVFYPFTPRGTARTTPFTWKCNMAGFFPATFTWETGSNFSGLMKRSISKSSHFKSSCNTILNRSSAPTILCWKMAGTGYAANWPILRISPAPSDCC